MSIEITQAAAAKVLEVVDAGLSSGLGVPVPGKMCVEAAVCYALGLPHSDEPGCVSPVLRSLKIALNDKEWSSPQARAKGMRRLAVAQLGSASVLNEKLFLAQVVDMTIRKVIPRALRATASIHPSDEHKQALEKAARNCETATAASYAASAASYAARAASYVSYAASYAASAASYAASDASYAARAARAASAASYAARAASYVSYAASDASYAASAASYVSYAASAASAASYAASAASYDAELAFFAEEVVQILVAMDAPGTQWLSLTETP